MNQGANQGSGESWLHTLLYVEDDPAHVELVKKIVARHADMRLVTAVDGASAIEIARRSRPDAIMMDINLPDISGFKVLEILRADPAMARIPVIALSANALRLNIESGLEAGFFRYLTKPVEVNECVEVLNQAFEFAATAPAVEK